jgi:hypothetical protein
MAVIINVARDFHPRPRGRDDRDQVGPFHGVAFRSHHLRQPLLEGQEVTVDFDGTEALGPSFLEEAFGGLVRDEHIAADALRRLLHIKSALDPSREDQVWRYIENAAHDVHHA